MVIRLYLKGKKKRFVVVFSMVVFLRLGYMYKFKFESVEYGEKWIAIYGQHMASGFKYALIGVYTPCSVLERRELWDDLTILR